MTNDHEYDDHDRDDDDDDDDDDEHMMKTIMTAGPAKPSV